MSAVIVGRGGCPNRASVQEPLPGLEDGVFFAEGLRPAVTVSMVGRGNNDWPDGRLFPVGPEVPPPDGLGSELLSPELLIAALLVILDQTLSQLQIHLGHREHGVFLRSLLLIHRLIVLFLARIVHGLLGSASAKTLPSERQRL